MAAYYLEMQPHLFRAAVESEFQRIKETREAAAEATASSSSDSESSSSEPLDLVLSKRMAEVRRMEEAVAIEDLMYVCILEKFQTLGVDLLPNISPIPESLAALKSLTEGVHTKEALDMVKEHVLSILGPASMALADTRIKMSKLQAAQVYAASIMFGYFLRRVDSRFQLAKQVGMVPESPEDAVARLERLFAMADEVDPSSSIDLDAPPSPPETPPPMEADNTTSSIVKKKRGALRQYVESFDQETMMATARLVTTEGSTLVERQTKALFGDVKALQSQMQEVIGQDATSVEELMQRVQQAVAENNVEVVDMTVGTQRRAVLEAVAYGCFLRDVESWVDREYALLTPVSSSGGGGYGNVA
jgi:gas vesicle protein